MRCLEFSYSALGSLYLLRRQRSEKAGDNVLTVARHLAIVTINRHCIQITPAIYLLFISQEKMIQRQRFQEKVFTLPLPTHHGDERVFKLFENNKVKTTKTLLRMKTLYTRAILKTSSTCILE